MFGSPIEDGTWNNVEAAYYTAHNGGEAVWLFIAIGLCVLALIVGGAHEAGAYRRSKNRK